uniref:Major facilitator superfamily (MFS) profile domain-containing protein n=1 Tax=Naja naja TaxID=35670 RepID=A0A8C6YJJ7_NAJNA
MVDVQILIISKQSHKRVGRGREKKYFQNMQILGKLAVVLLIYINFIFHLVPHFFHFFFFRKGSLVVTNFLSIISVIFLACNTLVYVYEFTICAHLLTGICVGFILGIVPLYVGEIAPRKYRGVIIFIHQFCLNIGILIAQILAIKEFLGNSTGWPALMAMGGILPLIQMFLLPFIPESPRYLMIHKKNEQQARKVLKMLRETDDVEDEIIELYQEDLAEGNNKDMTPLKLIRTPSMQLQIITIVVVVAGAQLSGISLVSKMYLVDTVGRRPLLLGSFAGYIITSVLLIVSLLLQVCNLEHQAWGEQWTPLPHLLTLEMFSQSSRASAFVISGSVFWSISFITGLSFYYIEVREGGPCSILFWPFCIATLVYIYKMIPETKMQTFPDIKRICLNSSLPPFSSLSC